MSIEGLLAIAGVVVAIYAVAQPIQRRSISLFVPTWVVVGSLLSSSIVLIWREGALHFPYELFPWSEFVSTLLAFLLPVLATVWGICRWWRARLTIGKDKRFRRFIQTCIREDRFDELVRIVEKNRDRIAIACNADTLDLLFEVRFVRAMVQARTWIHLELLTNGRVLEALPNRSGAVYRILRELLIAGDSPLRTSALLDEGGDETLSCPENESNLIDRTFRNPQWYHRCRVGYPVLITASERIDSGSLDIRYNRPDPLYAVQQGIATRSYCPVFLAEKTVANALRISIEGGKATRDETHVDAHNLYELFRIVYDRSKYSPETWDEPRECGDYPTPFGFIFAKILGDYEHICSQAWDKSGQGAEAPPDNLSPVVSMWALCTLLLRKNREQVSPKFVSGFAPAYLDMTLQSRAAEMSASGRRGGWSDWTALFIDRLKRARQAVAPDANPFLTKVADRLDIVKDHVRENHEWLRQELGLPDRPRPSH